MFGFKRKQTKDPIPTVICMECGHVVARHHAGSVREEASTFHMLGQTHWYCKEHKPPYDRYWPLCGHVFGQDTFYYKEFQVTVDGCPIGYVKEPELTPSDRWAQP